LFGTIPDDFVKQLLFYFDYHDIIHFEDSISSTSPLSFLKLPKQKVREIATQSNNISRLKLV